VVLIHEFLSALGLWVLNLDDLAKNRPVYAIDLFGKYCFIFVLDYNCFTRCNIIPGFGSSWRPKCTFDVFPRATRNQETAHTSRLCLKTMEIDVQTGGKFQLYLFSIYSPINELFQYRLDEIADGVQCGKPFLFFKFDSTAPCNLLPAARIFVPSLYVDLGC
jgi:hypothetical protein